MSYQEPSEVNLVKCDQGDHDVDYTQIETSTDGFKICYECIDNMVEEDEAKN